MPECLFISERRHRQITLADKCCAIDNCSDGADGRAIYAPEKKCGCKPEDSDPYGRGKERWNDLQLLRIESERGESVSEKCISYRSHQKKDGQNDPE